MGDTSHQLGVSEEFTHQEAPTGVPYTPSTGNMVSSAQATAIAYSPAFSPSHPQQAPQPQHGNPQHAFSSQLDMAQAQGPPRGGTFDMNGVANALPQYRPGPYSQGPPRYNAIAMSSPVSQFAAQGQQYYMPQHAHLAHFYQPPLSPQAQAQAQAQVQAQHVPSRPDLGYYPSPVVVNQQTHPPTQFYYPQPGHFPGQTGPVPVPVVLGQYATSPPHLDPRQPQPQPGAQIASSVLPANFEKSQSYTNEARQSIVRGPPRKPRQSGHAIWIGNLPPQTDLMSLVHHVCKEAEGLESLFLISKSNCAFANFKDELASVAAQRKLHDSKFLTVRLVSRLRKSTVEGPAGITAPTGPAASTPHIEPTAEPATGDSRAAEKSTTVSAPAAKSDDSVSPAEGATPSKDRFFILKSLTVEDIELSVRTGIWATQSHNEETLNNAFRNSDNVYLVFSANKSGEYFGYARMTSPINEDPDAAIEFAPKAQVATDVELPKAIPTEATEFAPKGRIIDDSARGTIFWEAERDEPAGGDEEGSGGGSVSGDTVSGDTGSVKSGHEGPGETKAWGKPFRLEWLSTARLPFYRTRGLRNPWNANREVKIARDGTELEASAGRRLIGLFNRVQSPALNMVPTLAPGAIPVAAQVAMPAAGYTAPMRPAFQAQ